MPTDQNLLEEVYQFYDEYRTLLLNLKYYGKRLDQFKRYNLVMESAIAIGAAGSGAAGFAVWQTPAGTYAWATISAISILLASVKPFLRFADRIENYGKLFGEYARACVSMKIVVARIQVNRTISEEDRKALAQIQTRVAELCGLEDSDPDLEFVRQLQSQVIAEISIDQLWVPSP